MSTVTHKPKVSNRQLVDVQIRATRRTLKLVDLLAGILTLTIGLIVFLLGTALLEHWVISGGWSQAARSILFILLIAGVAWYGWRTFWPLLWKPINPIYAAQTLEKSSPTLKNSLLSLLLFRRHRQQLSPTVYQALERQAAVRLSQVPVDTAVDRSAVLRLGYALVVVVAIFALYRLLSPKNPITSASRVLLPWSSIRAPSRVQILDIRPGDTSVARGERLTISAEVHGLDEGEPVVLHYQTTIDPAATRDWQSGELLASRLTIPMLTLPSTAPANLHWQCQLADATYDGPGTSHEGMEQNVRYWIEAGDARSAAYQVRVFARPTMVVKRVQYDYPAYTGYPPRVVVTTGDLEALEGTRVTLEGLSNQPIQKAFVDFDADGRHDMAMRISGDSVSRDQAQAQFPLTLRPDRRTPRHTSYVLRFTTPSGRSNRQPPKYRIAVTPDYAPEIRLLEAAQTSHSGAFDHATGIPEEIANVALDQQVTVKLEASDPDFALSKVRVVGYLDQAGINPRENPTEGTKRLDHLLLSNSHTGRLLGQTRFTPQQLDLHEGDVLVYWAEARDNRTPEANVSTTISRKVRVTGSQSPPRPDSRQQGKPQAESDRPDAGRPPEDPASEEADKDRTARQQPQDGDGEKDDGGEGGSAGGESAVGSGADGGQAAAGESGQSSGAAGGEPAGDAGAGNRETGSDQAGKGESQDTDRQNGSNSTDSSSGGGDRTGPGESPGSIPNDQGPNDQGPNDQGSNDQEQPGSAEGQQDSTQEKVSPEGDDDGTAFDRLREHFAKQEADQRQPTEQAEQDGEPGQQTGSDETSGVQEKSGDHGQDGQTGTPQDQPDQGQQKGQGEQAGSQGESRDDAQRADAQDDNAQDGQPDPQQDPSGQGPPDNQQGAQGRHAKTEQETESDPRQPAEEGPSGAPGEMSPEQGTPGAGDSQSGEKTTPDPQAARQPRDKQADGKEGKRPNDQQPPSVGRDQKESDSQGGQGGDRTGGGQEGAGGQADAEGTGGAGQHEAADDGSGQSAEPGTGQAGSQPGGGQQADGQTGQSSQNQPGDGSQSSGQPDRQQPGQPQTSDNPPEKQPGQKPDQQDTPHANQNSSQGTPPANSSGQSGQPSAGETSPDNSDPDDTNGQSGAGRSSQNGGGDGGSDGPLPAGAEQEAAAGDAANLDYARQQTDLILNRLSDQLNRERVDPRLLDNLGWSQQDLQRFVDRWKNLESLAAGTSDQAQAAQAELNAALRSLGLRKNRRMRYDSNHAKDNLRDLRDTYRSRIPAGYLERMRAYVKGTTQGEKSE